MVPGEPHIEHLFVKSTGGVQVAKEPHGSKPFEVFNPVKNAKAKVFDAVAKLGAVFHPTFEFGVGSNFVGVEFDFFGPNEGLGILYDGSVNVMRCVHALCWVPEA